MLGKSSSVVETFENWHIKCTVLHICISQGEIEFKSLLFIPSMTPFNTEDMLGAKTKNIRLYVKRVFISDEFDGELVMLKSNFHFSRMGLSGL
jgi:HSP90 family molecular chaperone